MHRAIPRGPIPILLGLLAVATSGWLACSGPGPSSAKASKQPNVLFIVWDTVRADRLGCYGHDLPTTPRLDAFAQDALLYERAISPGITPAST